MPNTKEINIGLNRFESTKAYRIFLVLMVMMMFYVARGNVEASDDTHDQETAITLIVDADTYDEAQLEATIDTANSLAGNGDIEKAQIQEITPSSLTVVIGSRDNVRSLGDNFGNVDSSYPRGNAEVIGYFTDGPLQSIASGNWLVLEGGQHAVYSGVVNEPDGSGVTDAEAQTTTLYEYDGTSYVPVVEAEAAPTTDPVDGDDYDDTEPTVEPTYNPDNLSFPEITPTITATHYTVEGVSQGVFPLVTDNIDVEMDHLLPFELGIVPRGASALTDQLYFDTEPLPDNGIWPSVPLSGIVLNIVERSSGNEEYNYVELLTKTPEGNEVVAIIRLDAYVQFYPASDDGTLAFSQDQADIYWNGNDVHDSGVTIAPTREIRPGDHIVLDAFVVEIENTNTVGGTRGSNMRNNGIDEGSIFGVFEAIDNGEINGIPFLYLFCGNEIIYNQD